MANEELIQHMLNSGRLKSEKVADAFRAVDRRDFVPKGRRQEAYHDYPLSIGNDATISQPSTVAFMLENLDPQQGDKILEVGSGSGWVVALLAHIVGSSGSVYGLEIVPELVELSKDNLKKYKFDNLEIINTKEGLKLPKHTPFDKIIVSAAVKRPPEELFSQLKDGGRMLIPIEASIWKFDKISKNKYEKEEFFGFSFVPLK